MSGTVQPEIDWDAEFDFAPSTRAPRKTKAEKLAEAETRAREEAVEILNTDERPLSVVVMDAIAATAAAENVTASDVVIMPEDCVAKQITIPASGGSVLYVDIETVPDYDRQHLFNLPGLPVVPPELPEDMLLEPSQFCSQTLDEIKAWFSRNNPCESWLQQIEETERIASGKKGNRAGMFDAIKKSREAKNAVEEAIRANKKKMGTTPEMCRIVAIGMALDDSPVIPLVCGVDGVTEISILETFWAMAKKAESICGFNIENFDLPVLFVRSMLLGVPSTKLIDRSPYRDMVIDLAVRRFGKHPVTGMGLKNLAKMYGIDVPAEGVDGSQVEALYQQNPNAVGIYVASDVIVTRNLHRAYSGYFC